MSTALVYNRIRPTDPLTMKLWSAALADFANDARMCKLSFVGYDLAAEPTEEGCTVPAFDALDLDPATANPDQP